MVMVENPILLHPDYNSSVRHIEQAIIANAHLPVDQQDRRYCGACAESTGISPHAIWGFVVLTPVYDVMFVMLFLWSLMLGLRCLVMCHLCQ